MVVSPCPSCSSIRPPYPKLSFSPPIILCVAFFYLPYISLSLPLSPYLSNTLPSDRKTSPLLPDRPHKQYIQTIIGSSDYRTISLPIYRCFLPPHYCFTIFCQVPFLHLSPACLRTTCKQVCLLFLLFTKKIETNRSSAGFSLFRNVKTKNIGREM